MRPIDGDKMVRDLELVALLLERGSDPELAKIIYGFIDVIKRQPEIKIEELLKK